MDIYTTDLIKTLQSIGLKVIDEEELPKVEDIRFRISLNGTRAQHGTCFKHKNGKRRILIHLIKARFVEDPKGDFINEKTGKKMRPVMGTERPLNETLHTLAHEIAHLKFWKHNPQHKSYTENLYQNIKNKLEATQNGS